MRNLIIPIIFFLVLNQSVLAKEFVYIMNEPCINELIHSANKHFQNNHINIYPNTMGITISFELKDIEKEVVTLSKTTQKKLNSIKDFLAKNKNPVIIEVHAEKPQKENDYGLSNWETTTIIANMIELELLSCCAREGNNRIKSVGYGEFLPVKNTPYNGFIYNNRVDIIVLCNVSGE